MDVGHCEKTILACYSQTMRLEQVVKDLLNDVNSTVKITDREIFEAESAENNETLLKNYKENIINKIELENMLKVVKSNIKELEIMLTQQNRESLKPKVWERLDGAGRND